LPKGFALTNAAAAVHALGNGCGDALGGDQ
jgi:hypothetical protein